MGGGEWRMIGRLLGLAALAFAGALAVAAGAAWLNDALTTPVFVIMVGLGVVVTLGLAAAAAWAFRKGGPSVKLERPPAPRRAIPPGAGLNAGLVGLVLIGSGGAAAVGLNDPVWFGLSIAAAALYGVIVFWPRVLPD